MEDLSTGSIVTAQWSSITPIVEISGTIDRGQVHVTFACSLSGFSGTASFVGTWNVSQSKYVGTFTGFDGQTGAGAIVGWSSKAPMPTSKFAFGAATVNLNGEDVIYVVGSGDGLQFDQTLAAYHPTTDTWTTAGLAPLPHVREGTTAASLGGLIYVAGGHEPGGMASTRLEASDPVNNTWSARASMNTARAEFTLAVANGSLYAIGGETGMGGSGSPVVASVERYDPGSGPGTDSWTTVADMPAAGSYQASGTLNIKGRTTIVVVGGENGLTLLYDVVDDVWTTGSPIQAQGRMASGGVVNNTFWVIAAAGGAVQSTVTAGYFPETEGLNAHPDGWAYFGWI